MSHMAQAMLNSSVPTWTLGDRLRRARTHLGVTQQELADRLGVGLRTIKEGEADKKTPKRAIVLGWAVACGVDPQWLEGDDEIGGAVTLRESHDGHPTLPFYELAAA